MASFWWTCCRCEGACFDEAFPGLGKPKVLQSLPTGTNATPAEVTEEEDRVEWLDEEEDEEEAAKVPPEGRNLMRQTSRGAWSSEGGAELVSVQFFPIHTIAMETFMGAETMLPFEDLQKQGLVHPTGRDDVVHFLSHEWLGLAHPDPEGVQLRRAQEVFSRAIRGDAESLFHKQDWAGFLEKTSGSMAGDHRRSEAMYGRQTTGGAINDAIFQWQVEFGEVWLDYSSIPQDRTSSKSSKRKLAAINSIPAYLERCDYFWVLAPPARHVERGDWCSLTTWQARGWCRLEGWGNFLSVKSPPLLVITHAEKLSTMGFVDFMMAVQGKPDMAPCAGNFTCCSRDHEEVLPDGTTRTMPCDIQFVAPVLKTLFDAKKDYLRRDPKFRYLHNLLQVLLEPILVAGCPDHRPKDFVRPSETVEQFLTRFAMDSVEDVGKPSFTLWNFAAWLGHIPMLTLLEQDEKALAQIQDPASHVGVVQNAAMQGKSEALQHLLDRGLVRREALWMPGGSQGITAMDRAAKYGFPETVTLLLEARADVDPRRMDGSTPLHGAAGAGHVRSCRVLLQFRAQVDAVDNLGRTPLHLAADPVTFYGRATGKPAALAALLEHGADRNAKDAQGRTPLEVAQAAFFQEGVEILCTRISP